MRLKERPWPYLLGISTVLLGIVFFVIAYSTHQWVQGTISDDDYDSFSHGLWKYCSLGRCHDLSSFWSETAYLYTVRTLASIALALYIILLIFLSVDNFTEFTRNFQSATKVTVAIPYVAGLTNVAGDILFALTIDWKDSTSTSLSWSFILAVGGAFLSLLGPLLLGLSSCFTGRRQSEEITHTYNQMWSQPPSYEEVVSISYNYGQQNGYSNSEESMSEDPPTYEASMLYM